MSSYNFYYDLHWRTRRSFLRRKDRKGRLVQWVPRAQSIEAIAQKRKLPQSVVKEGLLQERLHYETSGDLPDVF